LNKKLALGKKRNFLAALAKGEILVHMDDDDFYPPENVISRVKTILLSEGKECVGCSKTLCYDLIHDQTFEAFDASPEDGKPCTISESSLAYTKNFWKSNGYNDSDTNGECLAFMEDRHNQIILIPYIFVVTQLSHSSNTIQRWVMKGTKHTVQFTDNLSMMDNMLIQNLRATVILQFPEWKEAIAFVKKNHQMSKKNFIKLLSKHKNQNLKTNQFVINHLRSYVTKPDKSVSTESEGTEGTVVYYCGPGKYLKFSNTWDGNSVGLGGSEEAVVNITETLVKMGFNVTVYNVCKKDVLINGVQYREYWKWIPGDYTDATVLWRDPSLLENNINSDKIILDLHDVIDPKWIDPDTLKPGVVTIHCKSEFHKSLLVGVDREIIKVIPNGIQSKQFSKFPKTERKNIIMSTSSPDPHYLKLSRL
jgi:hypothetical protein